MKRTRRVPRRGGGPAVRRLFLAGMLACCVRSRAFGEDWPQYRFDAQRRNWSPEKVSGPVLTSWGHDLYADGKDHVGFNIQPVADKRAVYVGTLKGRMRAFAVEDGRELWRFEAFGPVVGTAALLDGRLMFATAFGAAYALAADTGAKIWEADLGPPGFVAAPLAAEDTLFLMREDGLLLALNPADGSVKWRFQADCEVIQTPACGGGLVYFMAQDRTAYAVRAGAGEPAWKAGPLGGAEDAANWFCPVYHGGKVMFIPKADEWLEWDWQDANATPERTRRLCAALGCPASGAELFAFIRKMPAEPLAGPKLAAEQDAIVGFLRENPGFQFIHILNAADGAATGITPGLLEIGTTWVVSRMPVFPPVVLPDGECVQQAPLLLPCSTAWAVYARWSLDTGRVVRRYAAPSQPGDEMRAKCAAGNLFFFKTRWGVQPSLYLDLDSGAAAGTRGEAVPTGVEFGDLNARFSPPSVAHGRVFDVHFDVLTCCTCAEARR